MTDTDIIKKQFIEDQKAGVEKESLRVKYLGRKGLVTELFKKMKDIPSEEKASFGAEVNTMKQWIETEIGEDDVSTRVSVPNIVPPSIDSLQSEVGHLSPVSAMIFRIQEILEQMGFSIAVGPELEEEHYNFDALNIPDNHPARDVWDTIWVTNDARKKRLLRTHTSPGQVRYMESHKPPIRIIIPGRVYRYEATDATHETAFHQVEGLMLDETTSIATFKGIMERLFSELFEEDTQVRLRPSYFPFTEPSFELDVMFQGKWLEVGGAGMVDRKVLESGGITDEKIQGFAFGIGVERMVMILTGLDDVRHIHSGDLRFAYQMGIKRNNNL